MVEHDEDTIRAADYVVDIGPGAGVHGGHVVAQGTPEEVAASPDSITGQYLSGVQTIPVPKQRRPAKKFIRINGCRENNLKNVNESEKCERQDSDADLYGGDRGFWVGEVNADL